MDFRFGYGTTIVASSMLYVSRSDDLQPMGNEWMEGIVSATPGMAGVSALVAGQMSDRLGRKKSIMISSLLFALGSLICSIGLSKWILLVGRLIQGASIGVMSMVAPIYLSESSPTNLR